MLLTIRHYICQATQLEESNTVYEELVEQTREDTRCVVCFGPNKTHAYTYCFHKCICRLCAKVLGRQAPLKCPVCMQLSDELREVFE